MCVSIKPASFANTIVSTWEIEKGLHCWAYQNNMMNGSGSTALSPASVSRSMRSGLPSRQRQFNWTDLGYPAPKVSGNAMILPIPLASGANIITDAHLLNTLKFKRILSDQSEAVAEREYTRGGAKGVTFGGRGAAVIVKFGPYEVVLAQSPLAAFDVLHMVSDEKRPQLDEALLAAYELWYPGWSMALACFNNSEMAQAAPIAIVGPARHSDYLFLPAVHGHGGGVPDLTEMVADDHTFVAGSCLSPSGAGNDVFYTDDIEPAIAAQLPSRVVGGESRGTVTQGDLVVKLADVYSGRWAPERLLPPGAAA